MKTIFKVGQKVYDQVNYHDFEGKILKILDDSLLVLFEGVENYYSLDGRLGDGIPTLSTSPYEVEFKGFEQKESVPDFYDVYDRHSHVFVASDYDEDSPGYPTKELADAAEALRRLLFLRDYYNEGWKPSWDDRSTLKFCIITHTKKLDKDTSFKISRVMTFKTEEIRDKFLEEQRELLEIAKPLL